MAASAVVGNVITDSNTNYYPWNPQTYTYPTYYYTYPVPSKEERLRFALELIEGATSLAEAKRIAEQALGS